MPTLFSLSRSQIVPVETELISLVGGCIVNTVTGAKAHGNGCERCTVRRERAENRNQEIGRGSHGI